MADLSDVTAYLASTIAALIYPNGTASPSVINAPVKVFEGWPVPDVLEADLKNGVSSVSIFPMQGSTATVFQQLDLPYLITPPVHALTLGIASNVVTVTGTPASGQYVTVKVNSRQVYSRVGTTAAAILAALQADIVVDYPGTTATATTLTIIGATQLSVLQGAPATMAQVTHRQKQSIMVTVWAPDPQKRSALCNAIDIGVKGQIRATLADTSEAIILYEKTNVIDDFQAMASYRRDLIYTAEYATLDTFTVYEVTSVTETIDPTAASPGTSAITKIS